MQIDAKQMAGKPKKIGKRGGRDVRLWSTKGGLHLVVGEKDGRPEVLGTGPHPAVARHIARKHAPDIEYTELSKADHVDLVHFEHLLEKYEAITDAMRRLGEK